MLFRCQFDGNNCKTTEARHLQSGPQVLSYA